MKLIYALFLSLLFSNALFAQTYPRYPANGRIAYYPFSGNANDYSGNGYDMTVTGAMLCADRFGDSNAAYQFNGVDNTITYSSLLPTDSNFTYSCWVSSPYTQNALIIHNGNSDYNGYGLAMMDSAATVLHTAGNNITLQCSNVGYFGTHYLPTDGWHHFVFRVTGGNMVDYFFDGKKVSTMPVYYYKPTGRFEVGRDNDAGGYAFKGDIDDISVYARAVDSLEILQLYYGCYAQISTQPKSDTVIEGGATKLFINTIDTFHTVQWQINTGAGFVKLTGTGPFAGVNSDTLNITALPSSLNNALYRCIVTNIIGCTDTSYGAKVAVKTTAVNDISNRDKSVNIYPNPVTDKVRVEFQNSKFTGSGELLDAGGRVIDKKEIKGAYLEFNMENLAVGTYLVRINNGNSILTRKVVKE